MDAAPLEPGSSNSSKSMRPLMLAAACLLLAVLFIVGYQFLQTKNRQASLEEALMSQKLTDEQKLLLMQDLEERTKDVAPLSETEKLKLIQQNQKEPAAPPLSDAEKIRLIESSGSF